MAEMTYKILKSNENPTDMTREEIRSLSSNLPCGCPDNIMNVIDSVRGLINEQSLCIAKSPSGFVVHSWLLNEAMKLERESLQLLSELLQKEGVI